MRLTLRLLSQGYDFAFLRRSRIYEECSKETRYKWTTAYVGGNKLAVCSSKYDVRNPTMSVNRQSSGIARPLLAAILTYGYIL